jgi:uncharacterized protein (TIGR02145 family)
MKSSHRNVLALIAIMIVISCGLWSQGIMRITLKNSDIYEYPVDQVESVTFVKGAALQVSDELRDGDGNVYKTVKIGDQVWMAENLRTSKYIDGTPIPELKDNKTWSETTGDGFCWYNNDSAIYDQLYGKLYNWQVVNSGKLVPRGWRIPTDEDWDILIKTLGGDKEAGAKMKVSGKIHWQGNDNSTNESGFGAYSGFRSNTGAFMNIGVKAMYWSGTQNYSYPNQAWARELVYSINGVNRISLLKNHGCFVRLIKE